MEKRDLAKIAALVKAGAAQADAKVATAAEQPVNNFLHPESPDNVDGMYAEKGKQGANGQLPPGK